MATVPPEVNGNSYQTSHQSQLVAAAHDCHSRGWTVIPVTGKIAACPWKKFQQQRPDVETFEEWFADDNITGLAVILGSASGGLACRDFDTEESYYRWRDNHEDLATSLPTVKTARGFHVYFNGPEWFQNLPDGEYRADPGHYCLLPPSRHPDGSVYRWLIPLPSGELPQIGDPGSVGLLQHRDTGDTDTQDTQDPCNTETQETHETQNTQDTHPSHEFSALLRFCASVLHEAEPAIAATLPSGPGQRYHCIFRLARHLKGIPSLKDASAGELRPVIEAWHQRARPVIRTKEFLDTWADFVHAWERVKVPAGESPVEIAAQRAKDAEPPPAAVKLYGAGPIILLATFCRELQLINGEDKDFFLDCRTAARIIGTDHTTAWRYLEVLCADGILIAGAKGSKVTRKASQFRFNLQKEV